MLITHALPLIILSLGAFLLIKLRFFFVLHPLRSFGALRRVKFSKDTLSSLLLALAGTLGVGNIVGVAVGISVGGAGCLFWLMLSAIPSAIIKYSEVTLSIDFGGKRGILGAIEGSFPKAGGSITLIYSALCLTLSLTMGAPLQSNALSGAAWEALDIPAEYIAIPFCLLLIFVFSGSGKRVIQAVNFAIPFATVIYIALCLMVIIPNAPRLPSVIARILSDAFTPSGIGGGIIGIITSRQMSEGFARGMLSNEAGAGSSSFAHGADCERAPALGGIFGIIEVFFDTLFLCPMTGFAILLGAENSEGAEYGLGGLCKIIRDSCGNFSVVLLFISISAFALSTIFCWYYYGQLCTRELMPKFGKFLYFPIFIFTSVLGLFLSAEPIIYASDILLFAMTVIVSTVIIKNCDRIKILSQRIGLLPDKKSKKPDK